MKQFFPEAFVTEDLNEYEPAARREFAMTLLDIFVPSKVGEDEFMTITQGRAETAKATKGFFSTCGELAMFLLHQMGYRGECLNRGLLAKHGEEFRAYRYGQNMAYLFTRAKKGGHFVPFIAGKQPLPGDICYITNADGSGEHVLVFKEMQGDTLVSYDGGQTFSTNKWDQCAKIRERKLVGKQLGDRTLHGWLDISTLKLTKPATLLALPFI